MPIKNTDRATPPTDMTRRVRSVNRFFRETRSITATMPALFSLLVLYYPSQGSLRERWWAVTAGRRFAGVRPLRADLTEGAPAQSRYGSGKASGARPPRLHIPRPRLSLRRGGGAPEQAVLLRRPLRQQLHLHHPPRRNRSHGRLCQPPLGSLPGLVARWQPHRLLRSQRPPARRLHRPRRRLGRRQP